MGAPGRMQRRSSTGAAESRPADAHPSLYSQALVPQMAQEVGTALSWVLDNAGSLGEAGGRGRERGDACEEPEQRACTAGAAPGDGWRAPE